jgi:AraC-like DNA-binding protein
LYNTPILWIDGRGTGVRDAGFSTPWREIPSFLVEFSAGGSWTLDIEGEPSQTIPPGRILLVPAGTRHRLRVVSGPSLRSWWLFLRVEAPAGINAFAKMLFPRVLPPADSDAVRKLAVPVIAAEDGAASDRLIRSQAAAFAIVERLIARASASAERALDSRMESVLAWLEANLHRPVNLREIARVADLSPSRLHDIFIAATGRSPIDWTIRARVRRAQRLLLADPRPGLEAVAANCGFATSYYLCRTFRKVTGTTPLTWREMSRK